MAVILSFASGSDVKLGRLAGQFAKPRSSQLKKGDLELPSYLGDMINCIDFQKAREPDER